VVEGARFEIWFRGSSNVGSNPTFSVSLLPQALRTLTRPRSRGETPQGLRTGELTEWSKVHDWKSCIPKGIGGSNPPLSASLLSDP
jgi:hypothetical protein